MATYRKASSFTGAAGVIYKSRRKDALDLPCVATASLPTAATDNEGAVDYDTTLNVPTFSNGTSWLPIAMATRSYSSATSTSTSIGTNDGLLLCTTSGAALTVLLPAATGTGRRIIIVFAVDGGYDVVISTNGTDDFFSFVDSGLPDNGDNRLTLGDAYDFAILTDALTGHWLVERNGGGTLTTA